MNDENNNVQVNNTPVPPNVFPQPIEPTAPVEPEVPQQPVEQIQSIQQVIPTPIDSIPTPSNPVESIPNKKSSIVPIIVIIFILLLLGGGGVGGYILYKNSQDPNSKRIYGDSPTSRKTTTACSIEREHIHLSELSEEEQKKYKIFNNNLYLDSDIKSIVYNGKEYDFKEVVSALTDFDKMTTMISQEECLIKEYVTWNNRHANYETKINPTKEEVAHMMTYYSGGTTYQVRQGFFIAEKGTKLNAGQDHTKHLITVRWGWDYDVRHKATTDMIDYYIVDSSYYGQQHDSANYIQFEIYTRDPYEVNHDIGIVLSDGRYVHMLKETYSAGDYVWTLVDSIYVYNHNYDH